MQWSLDEGDLCASHYLAGLRVPDSVRTSFIFAEALQRAFPKVEFQLLSILDVEESSSTDDLEVR